MWKKVLAGASVLALVMVAFAGAVYAQAKNTVRVSEKIDGKIADYKAANPEWKERLVTPEDSLWIADVICWMLDALSTIDSFIDFTPDWLEPGEQYEKETGIPVYTA